jgi:hypothetical protein
MDYNHGARLVSVNINGRYMRTIPKSNVNEEGCTFRDIPKNTMPLGGQIAEKPTSLNQQGNITQLKTLSECCYKRVDVRYAALRLTSLKRMFTYALTLTTVTRQNECAAFCVDTATIFLAGQRTVLKR